MVWPNRMHGHEFSRVPSADESCDIDHNIHTSKKKNNYIATARKLMAPGGAFVHSCGYAFLFLSVLGFQHSCGQVPPSIPEAFYSEVANYTFYGL